MIFREGRREFLALPKMILLIHYIGIEGKGVGIGGGCDCEVREVSSVYSYSH